MVASGQRRGETLSDHLLIAVPMFLAGIAGNTAGVAGLIAVLRQGERAMVVFAAILVARLILAFAAGEILVPH